MKKFSMFIAASLLIVGCAGDKATEVTTGDAQEVNEVTESTTYEVGTSSIAWRGFKSFVVNDEHVGNIGISDGSFEVSDGKVVGGSVVIDMNSIENTDIEDEGKRGYLVGHLKSQDFFFVDSFPTAQFEIVNVKETEGGATNSIVVGNLTIRGITHSIEFPANVTVGDASVSFSAPTFGIDRTKWDVKYHDKDDASIAESLKEKLIDHTIELNFDLNATYTM